MSTRGQGVPRTMRVALSEAPGRARVEERPVPTLGPGDALVRTAVVGVCAGDVAPWYVARKVPCVLGHEPAGTVAAVGSEVEGLRPGDRVFFHHHAPCFRCDHCRARRYTLCATWRRSRLDPGGLAEYVRVPAENLADTLVLPDGVSFEDASLVEPLACCVKALRRVGLRPGESVVLIGLGSMGQLTASLARAAGAGTIVGSDLVAWRRERGLEAGCDVVLDPRDRALADAVRDVNGGRLADVVLVGPGAIGAMREGLSVTAPGGRWCCFWPAPPEEELPISTHDLYFDEITMHFSYSCGPDDTREALARIRRGAVRASKVVTHRYPLEETERAFEITTRAGESLKALVVVDPELAGAEATAPEASGGRKA